MLRKHTQTNSEADRQKLCKDWGTSCDKCKKPNHLSPQCCSTLKQNTVVVTMEQAPPCRTTPRWPASLATSSAYTTLPEQSSSSMHGTFRPPCSPPPWRTSSPCWLHSGSTAQSPPSPSHTMYMIASQGGYQLDPGEAPPSWSSSG